MWQQFVEFELGIVAWLQALRSPVLDMLMKSISFIGNAGLIWIAIAIVCLAVKKQRRMGFALSIALIISFLLNNLTLKPLIGRLRPFVYDPSIVLIIKAPGEYSFPSGHTLSSFAAAYVIYHHNKRFGIAAYCFAAIMGLSRLYLQVHYPSDVLGGAIIGIAFGALACFIAKKLTTI